MFKSALQNLRGFLEKNIEPNQAQKLPEFKSPKVVDGATDTFWRNTKIAAALQRNLICAEKLNKKGAKKKSLTKYTFHTELVSEALLANFFFFHFI